jgi:hypothetical protein
VHVTAAKLTQPAINWLVAKSLGMDVSVTPTLSGGWKCITDRFQPCSSWADAGSLVSTHDIQWARIDNELHTWLGFDYLSWRMDWESSPRPPVGSGFSICEDHLQAICLAVIDAEYGDDLMVPEVMTV